MTRYSTISQFLLSCAEIPFLNSFLYIEPRLMLYGNGSYAQNSPQMLWIVAMCGIWAEPSMITTELVKLSFLTSNFQLPYFYCFHPTLHFWNPKRSQFLSSLSSSIAVQLGQLYSVWCANTMITSSLCIHPGFERTKSIQSHVAACTLSFSFSWFPYLRASFEL